VIQVSPRTARRLLATAAAAAFLVAASASGAGAADGSIVNVERTDAGLEVSVDVPPDAEVDLAGVSVSVDGRPYDATATRIADGTSRVQRTTVLAIDTSNSMRGERFDAAKSAARSFLAEVPADVAVGIVSFDGDVEVELDPTTDRDQAAAIVDQLELSRRTLLYDGVIDAVALTGDEGQRSVLVLSDGADTGETTSLDDVTDAIEASDGVVVDVVSLERGAGARDSLSTIAGTSGEVISSDSASLTATFTAEAAVLARQVGVSIAVPADVATGQVSVQVTLPSSVGDVVAATTLTSTGEAPTSSSLEAIPQTAPPSVSSTSPSWLIYAGVVVFGLGLVLAFVMLVPAKPVRMSAEERVTSYTAATFTGPQHVAEKAPEPALTKQASDAIAGVLERNQGLDAKISQRLEAAGSALKSSEWLLVHAGVFLVSAVVGLLLGGGNLVVGILFMLLGGFGPWTYLGFRANRRRRAFDAALPETLQLMSSSLSAGLSLLQSIDTIVREGADPVAPAFKRVLVETRIGVSLETALESVADRFDSQDFRWVVMAIRIQRQVGGNLAELLDTVAGTMREREYMRRQVGALAAEGKLSAFVLGALPPGFLLYLLTAKRDYVMVLFTDPRGIIMIVGAALWLSIGIFWMSKLVKVEV
jgi:tight adherence protein B